MAIFNTHPYLIEIFLTAYLLWRIRLSYQGK